MNWSYVFRLCHDLSLRDLRTLFRHYYVITHTSPYAPRTTCGPAPQINPVLIEDSMFGLHISEQPPQPLSGLSSLNYGSSPQTVCEESASASA
jgi:hypothetical protein